MQSIAVIATYGTIAEVVAIIVVMLATVFYKIYARQQLKASQKLKSDTKLFLTKYIDSKTQVVPGTFPEKMLDLGMLLQMVREFDESYLAGNWLFLRANFIKNIVLPLARTAAFSDDWVTRHLATLAFTLYSENKDEQTIINLLNDPIPLVRYSAAGAAIRHGSELSINNVVVQISRENWLTQTMYMKGFVTIPNATHYYLENIMKNSSEISIRATTYNLLLNFPVFPAGWSIADDIRSPDTLLATAAIRYLAYSKKMAAVETLQSLLSTPNWKIKAVVLACLGELRAESAIYDVKDCLNDPNWWIRLSAEQALTKISLPGEFRGQLYIEKNRFNIDVSQHVLNTF
jgi:hypothetical protein